MASTRLHARSARPAIENEIERLIGLLDARDADPDLEDNGDLEPSIGTYARGFVDVEDDRSDDEPSLGSLDRAIDQRRWAGPDCLNASSDLELQPYVSADRPPGAQGTELMWRERDEMARVGRQLAVIIAGKSRRVKADARAARRTAQ